MGSVHNDFIDRLRGVIADYENTAARLEAGEDKAYRTSRTGEKEDISLQTAEHYRRLLSHYKIVVARHEARNAKPSPATTAPDMTEPEE